MWRDLLEIFQGEGPMASMDEAFERLLAIALRMASLVEPHALAPPLGMQEREAIYALDAELNALSADLQRRVIAHLVVQRRPADAPRCVALLSMVRDVERIGDHVKNIAEVSALGAVGPGDPIQGEVEALIAAAMDGLRRAPGVLRDQDQAAAEALLERGRRAAARSDRLLVEIADSDMLVRQATAMALLTRYYKRVIGHLSGVLASVVVGAHELDSFDEDEPTRS